MSATPKIRLRQTGAKTTVGRTGGAHVVSATGGEIDTVTGASDAGFNPLDLLYASLSACLAISARMAAGQLGVLDQLAEVTVAVTGEKAEDGPSRVARFDIDMRIVGTFDDATRNEIARLAETSICTVSNTINGRPDFAMSVRS